MIKTCQHDIAEMEIAVADGICPICLSRRLRELEKESEGRRIQLGVCSIERTAEWKRAEQAESSLRACQVREAELREAVNSLGLNVELYPKLRLALSHSTGSKIMAVVKAATELCDSGHNFRPYVFEKLIEATRALEAKHER